MARALLILSMPSEFPGLGSEHGHWSKTRCGYATCLCSVDMDEFPSDASTNGRISVM